MNSPLILSLDLGNIVRHSEQIAWQPFQEGVEIHRLYGDGATGPSAALLRYQPGGKIPLHEHVGYEHLFILSGSQSDGRALATAGSFIINLPGTRHSVISEEGCLVLAIYEKAVSFL